MKVKIKEKYENISFINITDVYNYFILKIIDKSKYIVLISEIKEPVYFQAEPQVRLIDFIPGRRDDTNNAFTDAPFPAIRL